VVGTERHSRLEDRSKGLGAGIGEKLERKLAAATRRKPSRKRCHATPSHDDQRGGVARPRWREILRRVTQGGSLGRTLRGIRVSDEGVRVEGRSNPAGNIEGTLIPVMKRSEPHGRLRDETSPRRSSGASRRSRVERQGRNESGGGRSRPKGVSGAAHARSHEHPGVDARSVCRRRGSLWTTP